MAHETHLLGSTTEIDGKTYQHCLECGALSETLDAPCVGKAPSLLVHDDGDAIQIIWSFPEGGTKSSVFPQPLVTVDRALDDRPIGVVFAGPRARELRLGVGNQDNLEARSIAGLTLEFALDVLNIVDPETGKGITSMASYERVKQAIKATRGEAEWPV